MQKYREKLADEQELIAALANIVMEIYAMESSLLRAQKAAATKGEVAAAVMIDAARVFIADAAERVEHEAKRAVAAVHEGDMLTTQLAVLKRFGKRPIVDTIAPAPPRRRRRVSAGSLPLRRAAKPAVACASSGCPNPSGLAVISLYSARAITRQTHSPTGCLFHVQNLLH